MSLLARPGTPVGQAPQTPLPLLVAGGAAGVAAAALSYGVIAVVALAAWMLDPGGPQEWTQMLEAASAAWLAGLGIGPTIGGITITLVPLGFGLVLVLSLVAAARWASDASAVGRPGEALVVALSAAVGCAAVGALIATLSRSLSISPLRAAIVAAAVAFVISAITVLRRSRVLARNRIPDEARDVLVAAAAALLALVAMGSLALAVAIVMNVDGITAMLVQLDPGPSGVLLLTALSLGYLPIAITWAVAYLLGPGISLSAITTVSPYGEGVDLDLPDFPLLAALPQVAPMPGTFLPLAGIAAGVTAGALLRRRGHTGVRVGMPLAAGAGVGAGIVVALAAWLASGSVGTVAMTGLGPAPLSVGAISAILIAVGGLAVASWPSRDAWTSEETHG